METIDQRLKWAREKRELTQMQLAELAGVSTGTIGNIEAGTRKNPRELLAIAHAVGVSAEWLKSGRGSPTGEGSQEPQKKLDANAAQPNLRRVWVVGTTQGGVPERIWDDGDHPVGSTDAFADAATIDSRAFAVRVVGDSMVPRYMPGEFALVEPGTEPELEDDVLVRLQSGETMLKKLLGRRGHIRLGSYNNHEVLAYSESEITWMYYVAHPIPARRIQQRVDEQHWPESAPGRLR